MSNKIKLVTATLFLVFLITACTKSAIQIIPEQENKTTEEPSITGQIQEGDIAEINFVLYGEDGRIIDTNDKKKAQEAGLKTYAMGAYKFVAGQSGKIKGFDEAIIGLNKGDKKTISIPQSTSKIQIEFNKTAIESRIKTIPRKQKFSSKHFKDLFNKPPIPGDVVANRDKFPWPYKILAITNNSILGEIAIREGQEIQLPGTQWPSKALAISERVIQFLQMPKPGQTIQTEFGTATVNVTGSRMMTTHYPELGKEFYYTLPSESLIALRYEFKVKEITENTFIIERINYPEQETLSLDVEILDITPAKEIRRLT